MCLVIQIKFCVVFLYYNYSSLFVFLLNRVYLMRQVIRTLFLLVYKAFTLGFNKDKSFSRYAMYESISEFFPSEFNKGKVLSISHSGHLLNYIDYEAVSIFEKNFPEETIFDIKSENNTYDLVLSDQVFEHIDGHPADAINEVMRVLKPGGLMLHTTCMFVPVHGEDDYWRYTPNGLKLLTEKCGARCLVAKGVGGPSQFLIGLLGWTFLPVPTNRYHPFNYLARSSRNSYPTLVWVVAQKPLVSE